MKFKELFKPDVGIKGITTGIITTPEFGRGDNYAPYVNDIIKKYQNKQIQKITISRKPIQDSINTLMNVMMLGKLKKRMKRQGYDDLFHLRLIIQIGNRKVAVEKNEKINMVENPPSEKEAELRPLNLNEVLTFGDLIKGAERIQGSNLHKYSASSNNCQDYVMALLRGSNLGTEEDYAFVKQDTDALFNHYGFTKKIQDMTTDIAGNANEVYYGSGTPSQCTAGENKLVGLGVFQPKINYSKIRKAELKTFVKNNKKQLNLDINISGLTKKDLVGIVDNILEQKYNLVH